MRKIFKRVSREIKILFSNEQLVDFVICGTQKGGVFVLNAYWKEHPEICMADKKEVCFFD